MLHPFWCRMSKTCCCCFTQNKFKRTCSTVRSNQRERGVLRNLVLWKWMFHHVGEINFRLKSLKNTLEDVQLQLGCMLLSYNFPKKTSYSFFNILSTIAEQYSCTRPLNGCLVTLKCNFWLQSQ